MPKNKKRVTPLNKTLNPANSPVIQGSNNYWQLAFSWQNLKISQQLLLITGGLTLISGLYLLYEYPAKFIGLVSYAGCWPGFFFNAKPQISDTKKSFLSSSVNDQFIDTAGLTSSIDWQSTISYEDATSLNQNIQQDKIFPQATPVVKQKLKEIKQTIEAQQFTSLEQKMILGMKVKLVPGKLLKNNHAMTNYEGEILFNENISEILYQSMLRNELSHRKIWYINKQKCVGEPPSEEKIRVFYPFINQDWSIKLKHYKQFAKVIRAGFNRITDLENDYKKYNQQAAISENNLAQLHHLQKLLDAHFDDVFAPAHLRNQPNKTEAFFRYINIMRKGTAKRSGSDKYYELIELLSSIEEFDAPLRNYLFPAAMQYIEKYYEQGLSHKHLEVPQYALKI